MNTWILFAGAGIFVTIGDLVLAQWARTSNWPMLIAGLLLNLLGIACYANTLRFSGVGVATAIFLGINILAVAFGGMLFFKETFSLRTVAGMTLLLTAILLVEV